ncbi:MAG: SDR family oxidoreductase [Rhodocyclaceae bacterium]|nr:SDR family oxidoreductase [Rhodocyclaceae bacterium]
MARKGVTVNAIAPGYVGTDMVMAIKPEVREQIVAQIPMGRLGKPEEIGKLVAYPFWSTPGYMTDRRLSINGGLHMS